MLLLQTYGQLGAVNTSQVALKELAASCTATGRKNLLFARDYMVNTYGAVAVYGDSVAATTPLVIMSHGMMSVERIEALGCIEEWATRADGKEVCVFGPDVQVWSDEGWTDILQIVRHRLSPTKKMFRVITSTGIVDVTGDHSMLRDDGHEVRPVDLQIGDRLLHRTLPLSEDGWPFKHLSTDEAADLGSRWSGRTRIPDYLLNSSLEIKQAFWRGCGVYRGRSVIPISADDQVKFASLIALLSSMGLLYEIEIQAGALQLRLGVEATVQCRVLQVQQLSGHEGCLVYDLTTQNHHFQAGAGDLVVHNTDSVFMRFDTRHPDGTKMVGLDAVRESMRLSEKASAEVSAQLDYPHFLEREKIRISTQYCM